MRISLFAPAAALLGLFAINAQAADMNTMANSPESHNTHSTRNTHNTHNAGVQVHKAPQPQHRMVVNKRQAPQHKPAAQARNNRDQHDESANR